MAGPTDIFLNRSPIPSKDNSSMRWCTKSQMLPEGYVPVSRKSSKGLIQTGQDDAPGTDEFIAGNLILCIKDSPKVKETKGEK